MRKIWQLGATLAILGIVASCNLASAPPPSLPQVYPKPRVQKPAPTAQNPVASATNNPNLLLGNPSNAGASIASADNYLMVKPQYVMSYNSKTHTANWVSWQLNRFWIGAADRQDNFRPDNALSASWYKVRSNDYTGSGYDRGHIAPIALALAMKRTTALRSKVSNMMPQVPELNRGVWGDLEDYCRELVQSERQGTLHHSEVRGEKGQHR